MLISCWRRCGEKSRLDAHLNWSCRAAFRRSSTVTQTNSKVVGNTEMLPVSHVTGMRPKATVANKVELLGFHWYDREPDDLKDKRYIIMTLPKYIFLPSSSLLNFPKTKCKPPSVSLFPIMQKSAWCCLTCNIGLQDDRTRSPDIFSDATLGENKSHTEWKKKKKKNTALLLVTATNRNMTNLLL